MMRGFEASVGEYSADDNEVDLILDGEDDAAPATLSAAPGEDSPPLPDDWAIAVPLDAGHRHAAVGYSDDTARVSEPGEKRIYARDSGGSVTAEVYLQGDGSITITQAGGGSSITIDAAGAVQISATSVSLQSGTDLGQFLTALHNQITAWTPVPNDGGAALKAAIAGWLALTPPSP